MVLSSRLAGGVLAVAALTSCGSPVDEAASEPTAASTIAQVTAPVTEVPMATDTTSSTTPSGDPLEVQAITDLVTRLGVDAGAITVVRHDEVSWSDGSLGCPKPGFNYTQVITPGYLIVLSVAGRDYEYHGKPGGAPFYCAAPRPPAAGVVGGP